MATGDIETAFSRLPCNVVPIHYDLTFEPDLVNFTFTGRESVTVNITDASDTITVNSAELQVSAAEFEAENGSIVHSSSVITDEMKELVTIKLHEKLAPGKGILRLSFQGILNDRLRGFYRAKCPTTDTASSGRFMATTQFAPTDARRAFPCWDEPAIKATFKITLVTTKGLLAISNMPVACEESREDGKQMTQFHVTPIMSTYLLAFVVGNLDFVETVSKRGISLRTYTPIGKKEQGRFSLEMMTRSLDLYTDYFDFPFPLPKLDLALVPDFAFGAMENWGLITGREARYLYDADNTSTLVKESIALVNAHEVAHQWFGNLVTMEWWTHLWLNEGFATFMQFLCIDKLLPHLQVWHKFVQDTICKALDLDSLKSSHPVEVPINNPSEINEIFDDISYKKGASVIAMLYSYLGDDDFKKGLSLYLNRFKYQNAETKDLWTALEEVSSKPVGQIMSTWTKQKGFPVISVSHSQDGDKRILRLRQDKFSADGQLTAEEKEYLWMVPISVICECSPETAVAETILSSKSTELVVPNVKAGEWVKLNTRFGSIYRVQYSESMLEALVPAIKSKALPPLDRLNIVSDVFALAPAGHLSTVKALEVIEAFKDEDDYFIWSSVASCLSSVSLLILNTDFDDAYRHWGREFLSTIKSKIGWKKNADEKHSDSLLRGLVLSLLSAFNDPSVLEESKRLFDAYANDGVPTDADVRDVVYHSVAKQADERTFNTFLRLFRESDSPEEKNKLSSALGSVRDASLLRRTLEFAISEVRPQDLIHVFESLSRHKLGRETLWRCFEEKIDTLLDRYRGSAMLRRLVASLSTHSTDKMADAIESLLSVRLEGMDMTVNQVTEAIRTKAAWIERDCQAIKLFLNDG